MNRQVIFHGDKRQRLKSVCKKIFTGKTPVYDFENTEFLIIGQKNNQNGRIDISEPKYAKKEFYFSNSKDLFLQKGDIVLNSLGGGSVGRIGFFDLDRNDILTDGHPIIFRVNEYNNKKFIFYALLNEQSQLEFLANGSTNQCFLNISDVWNFEIPLPPLNEQKEIAEFLDKKCEIIDKRLNNLERKIKSLKEYKKSLISECVTKGLNPKNMEFKDSGIPWIGQIPKHWEIRPLYFYFNERKNKNLFENEKNLLSLSYGKIIRKNIETKDGLLPENFNGYNIIEKDDIVFRLTDLQNDKVSLRTGLVKEKGIITSAYVTIKPKQKICIEFYHYLLHCYDLTKVFYNFGNGVRQNLTYKELSKMKILVPPLNEQKEIAEFLDKKCEKIDRLNENYTKQIDTLKEYKKSIIYECVTGKKEI
ncbi:restriction endonuclease subunit S [uncultured Campylobacter sp.]|uniref:restriction endonuclease subunit S n=1 Tax=uncultured Campylobacter sp. TaxID=218934 RepID=UPI00259CCA95|nr:restriction endonuclease subunit S [uncultured Campylobacter sp.]